jgi:alkanesulfonate monooxygenase SsuD/methylene tetrahydromethanopterin reductase-like flavin-dependent oxidoreductase (luciferase family)
MAATRRVEFGYNPPAGERGIERIDPRTFVRDLQGVLDYASQHFSSFWVPDHFMRGDGFRMECWTQLTWLAARYPRQQLGTIVLGNSYRHPPLLAKMAASLQTFSGGRFILGYGAGWLEEEYRAYGYEFPAARVRIAQMVEGIEVMRALWTQVPANYRGQYYRVTDARCEPRPDPPIPILIGGDGERYLLRAVAEHADWWLPFSRGPETLERKIAVLRDHCRAVGRDEAAIRKAYPLTVFLARTREEAERRAGRRLQSDEPPFAGEPAALREHLARYVELGFDLFQLVFAGFPATDDMRLFVEEVLPAFQ